MARLTASPAAIEMALAIADQVGRIRDPARAVRRLADLTGAGAGSGSESEWESRMGSGSGVGPAGLGAIDRALLRTGVVAGRVLPAPVVALVRRRIRHEAAGVVLPAGEPGLSRHLAGRRSAGFGLNLNLLGEAILGDDEADRRRAQVMGHIRRPDVDYVSVKASALVARISSVGFEHSVERVAGVLATVLAEAGSRGVFVNLDMEEYRDLDLTLAAFRRALDGPELAGVDAGVVLQAYLPDAHAAFEALGAWAVDRFERAGGHTRVRIVKGANLAMERVDAELHGWVPAPFATKRDVDASYKRLLARALDPGWGDAVSVGLASHNLFDIAWGMLLAEALGTRHRLEVEMLEGMAPGQPEAVRRRGWPVRLYAPVVPDDELDSAVAYLARRLEENSGADNYLHHLLAGDVESDAQRTEFMASVATPPPAARSGTGRRPVAQPDGEFANVADTDWAGAGARAWIAAHLTRDVWPLTGSVPSEDPSHPGGPLYSFDVADAAAVERAVTIAARAAPLPLDARIDSLRRAAAILAERRGELIAAMVADAGKVVAEADIEVSEAVDYAAYYAGEAASLHRFRATPEPLGTVVVAPPWNFPLAIPMGGALAALAAGNRVILKPAPETVLTAWLGIRCLWDAGIPRDRLQFLPCADDDAGRRLISHPGVHAVILTGSHDTARMFLDWRPELHLLAETSGKNAIIVTAAADLDLAVGDVVRAAFGHAGQKCSAASLAIVEGTVLADGRFTRKLADATRSLVVGPAEDPATDVGPLIRPASEVLHRALCVLDEGETWLVEPRQLGPQLWSPGIRSGVREGSWFHRTECFGPVLGLMAADDLDHAIAMQSSTGYGLTGGLHSLDPAEMRRFLEHAEVGNVYVNRAITGAVVRRQPFGGWKRSAVGPTAKAGGPGYLLALTRWRDPAPDRIAAARASYTPAWRRLCAGSDPSGLLCERNILRHRPGPRVWLFAGADADPLDVELCQMAAAVTGVRVTQLTDGEAMEAPGRLRVLGTPPEAVLRQAHRAEITVDCRPPVSDGDIELRRWALEQTVSVTAHRYGRLLSPDQIGL